MTLRDTQVEQLYNEVGELYQASKLLPFRKLDTSHFLKSLGPCNGLSILDLACGNGFFTRLLAQQARCIIGVDISETMLNLAKQQTTLPNVAYAHADVAQLTEEPALSALKQAVKSLKENLSWHPSDPSSLPRFQLISACYLLNYAKDRAQLRQFLRVVYSLLEDGGRFVALNDNPLDDPRRYETSDYERLGANEQVSYQSGVQGERTEGDAITWKFLFQNGTSCSIVNYWIPPSVVEECFHLEGFRSFRWLPVPCYEEFGGEEWQGILDNCPFICMEAMK